MINISLPVSVYLLVLERPKTVKIVSVALFFLSPRFAIRTLGPATGGFLGPGLIENAERERGGEGRSVEGFSVIVWLSDRQAVFQVTVNTSSSGGDWGSDMQDFYRSIHWLDFGKFDKVRNYLIFLGNILWVGWYSHSLMSILKSDQNPILKDLYLNLWRHLGPFSNVIWYK